MKFLIGEGGWSYLERVSYRGVIGLFFDSTWTGVLSYFLFGLFCILAVIGLVVVLRALPGLIKPKSAYEKWEKAYKKERKKIGREKEKK